MIFKTTFFFNISHPPLCLLHLSSLHMKNKYGSNVRITWYIGHSNHFYHITALQYFLHHTHSLLYTIVRFLFLHYTFMDIYYLHFYIDFAHTFSLAFQFRSTTTLPFTFPVYINNLTLMATGCEDELSVVLLLHHLPCSLPRSLPVDRPRHRYING